MRRSYPRLSVVKQSDAVGLLSVGSAKSPIEGVLASGEEGQKQLLAVTKEGEERGLAGWFEGKGDVKKAILGPDGLPPTPGGLNVAAARGKKSYTILDKEEQAYPEE